MDFIDHRSTANFIFSLSATDEKFRITNNGDVGIGTSSPSTKLEVNGVITTAGLTTTANINFGDNDKAIFGAGSDLQIYHDGSNSFIDDQGTGSLVLQSNGAFTVIQNSSGVANARFDSAGAASLRYNGAEKLATTSSGIDVTGNATFDDNGKAIFGAGSDLQIYHDGSHSYVSDQGTGNLRLLAENFQVKNAADNEAMIVAVPNAGVSLYYNNSAKLATTSTGIDVTGTVTADGLTVDGNATINSASPLIYLTESDTTDLNTRIRNAAGNLQIHTGNDALNSFTARMNISHSTGDISFYEDTGTTAKLFWDASAESLGIGTSSPATSLHVNSGANGEILRIQGADAQLRIDNSTSNVMNINSSGSGDSLTLSTNDTERMRIDSSGRVGIGTSSPSAKLHIDSGASNDGLYIDSDTAWNSTISLQNNGSTKWLLRNVGGGANAFSIYNSGGGSEAMRIDSSGNVGIGQAPTAFSNWKVLELKGGTAGAMLNFENSASTRVSTVAYDDGNDALRIQNFLANPITFETNNTERMRLDSSGNLLVGTTDDSPFNNSAGSAADNGLALKENGQLQVASYKDTANSGAVVYLNRTSTDGNIIDFRKDGSTVGSIGAISSEFYIGHDNTTDSGLRFRNGIIQPCNASGGSNDAAVSLGQISMRFSDLWLSGNVNAAQVNLADAGGTLRNVLDLDSSDNLKVGTGSSAGTRAITFFTENTEQMRLDASGNLLVGKTSADNTTQGIRFLGSSGFMSIVRSNDNLVVLNRIDGDGTIMEFRTNGTTRGSISISGSTTSYNTSSDQRLKDNIVDAPSASDDIDAIQVRSFDWKADGLHQKYGMVAQELQSVVPEAVTGDADSDDMMGVDYSKLVPMMLKEIQSLRARVAELENN